MGGRERRNDRGRGRKKRTWFRSRIPLLLQPSHRFPDREMSQLLLGLVQIDVMRRSSLLVHRSDVLRQRRRDLRSIRQHRLAPRTSQSIPTIVQIPCETIVGRRAIRCAIEDVGNQIPIRTVGVVQRDEKIVVLRHPEQGNGSQCCICNGCRTSSWLSIDEIL